MTDEEFARGVDEILTVAGPRTHAAHRALDLLWTRYALEKGGRIAEATKKWMAAIEGDHADGKPYPTRRIPWGKRPLACKLGRHHWIDTTGPHDWAGVYDCPRCGAHVGYQINCG